VSNYSEELKGKLRAWLGEEGSKFFSELFEEFGDLNVVIGGDIPHPVHFREGMQVRNFLRGTGLTEDWSDHDYDDNWIPLVLETLELNSTTHSIISKINAMSEEEFYDQLPDISENTPYYDL